MASFMGKASAQPAGRPITLTVASAAGGTTNISARMLAEPLGKVLGTSVVVENRAGGNGNIAGQQVARGATDRISLWVQYSGSAPFRKRAEELGAKAVFLDGAELTKLETAERAMWERTIKVSGIKAD